MKEIKPKNDPIIPLNQAVKKFGIPRSTINYYIKKKYINLYKIPSYTRAISTEELKALRRSLAKKYKI